MIADTIPAVKARNAGTCFTESARTIMIGIRTKENIKFLKFFEMVQKEAKKFDSVFFLDCGQGKIFENNQIECEDLCGWLIPKEKVIDFEPHFLNNSEQQHEFDDFYINIDFNIVNDKIFIIIDNLEKRF